jgi:chromate transporter
MTTEPSAAKQHVSLTTLFVVFLRIGMSSLGGSGQAWLYRELVTNQRWLDEREFLSAMTLSQVLPGANPVNMALYVGSKFRGGLGGVACVLGLIGIPFFIILLLGGLYARFGTSGVVRDVMAGLIAIGVSMVLQLGMQLARNIRNLIPGLIAAAIFIAVGILHWPMIPVVLALSPLSIGLELFAARKKSTNG